jgi:hypothetical protein
MTSSRVPAFAKHNKTMAASFANLKDTDSLGVLGEVAWNCWFCSTGTVFNKHSRREWKTNVCAGQQKSCLDAKCKNKDHKQNVARWLGRVPAAGEERIVFSRVLDARIHHLRCESDKREIKSMLYEFIHETNATENSFLAIVNRLAELEKLDSQVILALGVWKRLAQGRADAEPMQPETFSSLKEIRSYLKQQRAKWKDHKDSVASSGSVQLLVQLVTPFIDWGTGDIKVEKIAGGPAPVLLRDTAEYQYMIHGSDGGESRYDDDDDESEY